MIAAINTALGGLRAAGNRVEQSAAQIVQSGLAAVNAVSQTSKPRSGAPSSAPLIDHGALGSVEPPDLLASAVSFKQAELQYKASAKLLSSLNRLHGETLDILS